jgi:hypothetical protein
VREMVAHLIFPRAFEAQNIASVASSGARKEAYSKADAILAALTANPGGEG